MDIYNSNWNEADASNTAAAPDGAPEGMAPSGVNDVLRAMMGASKRYVNQQIPKTTAGSSTAYTLLYSVAPGALVDGMTHLVQFHVANGAAATLNVNSLGAIPLHILKPAGWGSIPANIVIAGMTCTVAYNTSSGAYRIVSGPMSAVESGTSGYTVGPNSTRRQWGQVIVGSGTPAVISYPVPFSNFYSLQITANGNAGSLGTSHWVNGVSGSGFTLVNSGANNINFFWEAIGAA